MGLMALDQCMPLYLQKDHTNQPQMPTSSFYLLPEETSTPSFQEIPKVTETIHPSDWNIVYLWLIENMAMMMLSHPVLSATASFPSTPSENKPSDSSPYPLYATSTQEPVSAPKKNRQNDCQQISWDHEDAALLLLLARQPWWQLAYSLCTPVPVTVHFTLLKKLTLSHSFKMEIHTYNIHQCNR